MPTGWLGFAESEVLHRAMTTNRIFISHASEDKDSFVRPLAHALKHHGLQLWYDEFSLRAGDSLRRSIDRGLAECSVGLVVLSRAFFAKAWPQRELDALYTAEIDGRSQIIPIWHDIGRDEIARVSPLMADRVAIQGRIGVDAIALEVSQLVPHVGGHSNTYIAQIVEASMGSEFYERLALIHACQLRFLQTQAFKEEYASILVAAYEHLSDEEVEGSHPEIEDDLGREFLRLTQKYQIPDTVYLMSDEPEDEDQVAGWLESFEAWSAGTMSRAESQSLQSDLDERIDLDQFYILLGIPNFSVTRIQRPLLERAIVALGCRYSDECHEISEICRAIRSLDIDEP